MVLMGIISLLKIFIMTNTTYILGLIKSSGVYNGNDVDITVNELITLDHNIPPDDIIEAIGEITDIRISDKGIIIHKTYFE